MSKRTEGESEKLPQRADPDVTADLKVEILERLRVLSHDLKNALHGTSLSIEVVKSRIARIELTEKDINDLIIPFLENAAMQLDTAAKLHQQYSEVAMTLVQTAPNK